VLFGLALLWIRTLQRQIAVRTQELSQQVENGLVLQRRLKESLEIVGSEKTATEAALEAQKRSEQQYIDLSQELEKRVQERTAQLSASNEELEAFSYSISHDLRAPLRAIDGYTNLFLERYGDQLDGEAKRICGNIGANVHLMQHLIDDLLAYSRANRAELRTQTVDMDALVQEVWNQLTSTIDGGKITLALEPLPVARGDPVLLRQIWTNLLGNAIKYTSKKDAPRIAIGARAEPGATVYTVQDNGAGFDMRYADKLFGVFQRLHTQREFEGTGVGLAIVKRLVHRHGGSVWAEGEPGVGATFSFSIPNQ
jgi:light-regulated signal transduction histidine kinase (bacteriophytochrome)